MSQHDLILVSMCIGLGIVIGIAIPIVWVLYEYSKGSDQ